MRGDQGTRAVGVPSDILHGQAGLLNTEMEQALDAMLQGCAKPCGIIFVQEGPVADLPGSGRDKEVWMGAEENGRGSGSESENQVRWCRGAGGAEAAAGGGQFFEVFDVGKVVGDECKNLER